MASLIEKVALRLQHLYLLVSENPHRLVDISLDNQERRIADAYGAKLGCLLHILLTENVRFTETLTSSTTGYYQ